MEEMTFDMVKCGKDIEQRNWLRAEAFLPPLSMARELRKLYTAKHKAALETFFNASPLLKRVEAKLLARERRQRREPEWKPTGMLSGGGLGFSLHTRKVMRRIWRRTRRRSMSAIGVETGPQPRA
jgi:hypothetical protein